MHQALIWEKGESSSLFQEKSFLYLFLTVCNPFSLFFFFFTKQLQVILPLFSCHGNVHTPSSFELTPQFPEGSSFCAWRLQLKLVLIAFMGGENIVTVCPHRPFEPLLGAVPFCLAHLKELLLIHPALLRLMIIC